MARRTGEILVLVQLPANASRAPSVVEVNPLPSGTFELVSHAFGVRTEGPTRDQVIRDVYATWFASKR